MSYYISEITNDNKTNCGKVKRKIKTNYSLFVLINRSILKKTQVMDIIY